MNPTNPLQVHSFDHITIIVADLEATRKFYVDLLGMAESPRPDFQFPGAWFGIGNFQIHATLASDLAGHAGWGDRQVKKTSRGHHFAFEVANLTAAFEEVKRLAIEVGDGPKTRPDGVRQLYILDPDRHVVELFSQT